MILNQNILPKLYFNRSRRRRKQKPLLMPHLSKGHLSLWKSAPRAKAGDEERNIGFHVHSPRTQRGHEGKSGCDFTAFIFVMFTPTTNCPNNHWFIFLLKWHQKINETIHSTRSHQPQTPNTLFCTSFSSFVNAHKCKGDKLWQN